MWRRAVVGVSGVLVLAVMGYSTWQKEQLLTRGRVVLLELAPVDPRSLMQGDYMALRFAVAGEVGRYEGQWAGTFVAGLDERGVAKYRRLDGGGALAGDEVRIYYRVRGREVKLGTNAFFFQEGDADLYVGARYGEARVDERGQILLTGLRGKDLERLGR